MPVCDGGGQDTVSVSARADGIRGHADTRLLRGPKMRVSLGGGGSDTLMQMARCRQERGRKHGSLLICPNSGH